MVFFNYTLTVHDQAMAIGNNQKIGVAQLEYDLCDDLLFLDFKKLKA